MENNLETQRHEENGSFRSDLFHIIKDFGKRIREYVGPDEIPVYENVMDIVREECAKLIEEHEVHVVSPQQARMLKDLGALEGTITVNLTKQETYSDRRRQVDEVKHSLYSMLERSAELWVHENDDPAVLTVYEGGVDVFGGMKIRLQQMKDTVETHMPSSPLPVAG